jgi:hypothetical protein
MPRNTGTVLFDAEGNNRTATHLSTNIVIVVNGNPIGAIQTLNVTETRNLVMVDEIGTDGHIDSAPTKSTDYTIACTRIRFNRMRIAEAFGRGFIHAKSQRIPFDIEIHDRFHDADPGNAIVTTIQNCWIGEINYQYNADNFIITDTMNLQAEDIFSVFSGNNNVVGQVNARGEPIFVNPFERQADRGEFRGALDQAGLLDAFLSDSA